MLNINCFHSWVNLAFELCKNLNFSKILRNSLNFLRNSLNKFEGFRKSPHNQMRSQYTLDTFSVVRDGVCGLHWWHLYWYGLKEVSLLHFCMKNFLFSNFNLFHRIRMSSRYILALKISCFGCIGHHYTGVMVVSAWKKVSVDNLIE